MFATTASPLSKVKLAVVLAVFVMATLVAMLGVFLTASPASADYTCNDGFSLYYYGYGQKQDHNDNAYLCGKYNNNYTRFILTDDK